MPHRLSGLLRKSGLRGRTPVRPIGLGAWLVQAPWTDTRQRLRRLDDDAWLVQQGPRRQWHRVGPPEARSGLLVDLAAARAHMGAVQRGLGNWLAEEHVAHVLREARINCVLDVGANAGQYARRLRTAGYTGRIVSFEPVAEFVELLEAAAADDPEWRVLPYALGDSNTTAQINTTPGKRLSSLLPASDFGRKVFTEQLTAPTPETIEIRRLDGVLDEVVAGLSQPRVYLKMDTQGYDLQTFRGAGDRIGEVLAMQSEVACVPIYDGMPRLPEQLSEYERQGFEITGMYPVSRHAATLRVIEFDMVMVRAEALTRAPARPSKE
ncbi:FkbM family methyltransferase [Nocardioides mesophilus]|uniref:FkbM family methyltransferase n=1 Tax=Nocardioides mesophilus TaxID=433659 RepID=A0A7G9R6I0_9ACTN|nr:FkbM family methyltransferase [Nocardioides mesophilus]QNN51205.1 FkbM family methyltransferase [Nocardioides mesophilus]